MEHVLMEIIFGWAAVGVVAFWIVSR